jgi:Xaa-Pro aminopeptidase
MTADMPDPVHVAQKAAEQVCEGVALFEAERRRIHQAAEAAARAMQAAMAGREGEMDNWYESQLSAAIAELKRRAASRRGLSTITDEQLDAAMKRLRKDTPHD